MNFSISKHPNPTQANNFGNLILSDLKRLFCILCTNHPCESYSRLHHRRLDRVHDSFICKPTNFLLKSHLKTLYLTTQSMAWRFLYSTFILCISCSSQLMRQMYLLFDTNVLVFAGLIGMRLVLIKIVNFSEMAPYYFDPIHSIHLI
jgi:hypothetical protein